MSIFLLWWLLMKCISTRLRTWKWIAITKIWMGMADCNDDYQILKGMMRVWMGKQSAKILFSTERAPALSHLWFRQPSRRPTINFHKSISRPTRDFPQPWTLGGRASDNPPLTILLSSFSCLFSSFPLSLAFTPPSILLCFFFTLSFHLSPDVFLWKSS